MKKIKVLLVAGALAAATLVFAAPAQATSCSPDPLGDALCYVIGVLDGSNEVCLPNGKCING